MNEFIAVYIFNKTLKVLESINFRRYIFSANRTTCHKLPSTTVLYSILFFLFISPSISQAQRIDIIEKATSNLIDLFDFKLKSPNKFGFSRDIVFDNTESIINVLEQSGNDKIETEILNLQENTGSAVSFSEDIILGGFEKIPDGVGNDNKRITNIGNRIKNPFFRDQKIVSKLIDVNNITIHNSINNVKKLDVNFETETVYRYNAKGQLIESKSSNSFSKKIKNYSYDNAGNRKTISSNFSSTFD